MVEEKSCKKDDKLTKFQKIFIYFIIYAFIGWVLETLYVSSLQGHLVKRGFLFGPICPIYGCGAIMLITILGKFKKQTGKLFFGAIIIFSLFEYIVSFGLEALYGNIWWDYSTQLGHLNGRITLLSSFAWGVLALLFLNTVHPYLEKKLQILINKMPCISQKIIFYLLFLIYIIDTASACIFHVFNTVNYV